MQAPTGKLDEQELFHLALKDSGAQRHDLAIEKLKTLLGMAPHHAMAHHLLAAEHAEIGMLPRAVEGFSKALELDPQMHVARFQLGLAHYAQGLISEARQAWAGLEDLGVDHPFVLYPQGLLQIGEQQYSAGIVTLEKALTAEPNIPSLRVDIQRSIEKARSRMADSTQTASSASHLLASRYGEASNTEN